MTCKDCRRFKSCLNVHKSAFPDPDGDSWANWCDDFDSVYDDQIIEDGDFTIVQSGYNHHVTIWQKMPDGSERFILHSQCQKRLTVEELRGQLKTYETFARKVAEENDKS